MAEFSGQQGDKSCAFFGEGVTFKGSISAPEKIVVHGTVEGDVVARELLVGASGTIKGNVKVDQADIQGKVLENVEARVCLSLRKTGRIGDLRRDRDREGRYPLRRSACTEVGQGIGDACAVAAALVRRDPQRRGYQEGSGARQGQRPPLTALVAFLACVKN
jgi:hypothetical protein